MYEALILRPVQALYLKPLASHLEAMSESERRAVLDQAVIGWLQTLLLIVVIVQVVFAGLLRFLPPDVRESLSFLHRIEWAAYVGILLVGLQTARGYAYNLIVTNRFYALGWWLSKMRIVRGSRVNTLAAAYIVVIALMVGAILFVRVNGFLVRPSSP